MLRQTSNQKLVALSVSSLISLFPGLLPAGASCVVAKKMGDSLAIEWRAEAKDSVRSATEKAKSALRKKGYRDVFPQAGSESVHGFGVIVSARYKTYTGRTRNSYGCGFSESSYAHAEAEARRNLGAYSWGWKPEIGYKVAEKFRY